MCRTSQASPILACWCSVSLLLGLWPPLVSLLGNIAPWFIYLLLEVATNAPLPMVGVNSPASNGVEFNWLYESVASSSECGRRTAEGMLLSALSGITGDDPACPSMSSSFSNLRVRSRLNVSLCQLTGLIIVPGSVGIRVLLGDAVTDWSSRLLFRLSQLHFSETCFSSEESLQSALRSGRERFLLVKPCNSAATLGIIPWAGQVLLRRPRRRDSESLAAFGLRSCNESDQINDWKFDDLDHS